MANKKIPDLPASAGLAAADLFETVDDPSGTPASQKVTAAQIADFVAAAVDAFTENTSILADTSYFAMRVAGVNRKVSAKTVLSAVDDLDLNTAPDGNDVVAVSTAGSIGKVELMDIFRAIQDLPTYTTPATGDLMPAWDVGDAAHKAIAFGNFLAVVDVLTAFSGTIDGAADKQFFWDDDAGAIRSITPDKLAGGKHSIWMPAGAMTPQTTNGAAAATVELATNDVMVKALDFDASTKEYAQFMVRMPKGWDLADPTAFVLWTTASGTGGVTWAIAARALSDDDALDQAFGTETDVTDTRIADNDLHQTAETAAIDIAGTPAAGDLVVFRIARDVADAGDTKTGDARLLGVLLVYATNKRDDS